MKTTILAALTLDILLLWLCPWLFAALVLCGLGVLVWAAREAQSE